MKKWCLSALACFSLAGGMMFSAAQTAHADEWFKSGNSWYYLDDDGFEVTGWVKDNNRWYYMDKDGVMLTGWVKVNNSWYYMNGDGAMATGWVKDNNSWYFMNANGTMATGWIKDGGKDYYLSASGAMLANTTTPDGYFVNASGEWVPSASNSSKTSATSAGTYNVYNIDADYAIEADVKVTGKGGSVAKVVINGNTAAMSFDIVTDGVTTYLYRENILHNQAGGQDYSRVDQYPKVEYGKTYRLMIGFSKNGRGTVYLNGELLDTFWNPNMTVFTNFDPAVEAGASVDGSTVQAVFSNITVKRDGKISSSGWSTKNMDNNPGLRSDVSQYQSNGIIRIGGTLQLRAGENWDTAYDGTSGKVYFQ